MIGRVVGQDRLGLSDDDYRSYVRARVAAHRSTGTFEDLIKVVSLVMLNPAAFAPRDPVRRVDALAIEQVAFESECPSHGEIRAEGRQSDSPSSSESANQLASCIAI